MKPSKTFLQQLKQMDREYWFSLFIVIALSIVSFYTSFDGVTHYIATGDTEASWSESLFLGFMVFIIQLLLVFSLGRLSQPTAWRNKAVWLLMYFMGMGIS